MKIYLLFVASLLVTFFSCKDDADIIPIIGDFRANDSTIDIYDTVTFTNLSKNVDLNDASTSFTWYFEGGFPETSTVLSPKVVYKTAGSYAVKLVTKYIHGKDSLVKSGYIKVSDFSKKGLVGFYPFNGNANDESGNGKNGIVTGATLCKDEFQNSNAAYLFNRYYADRIECGNDPIGDDESFTISVNVFPKFAAGEDPYNEYIISTGGQVQLNPGYYMYWRDGKFGIGRRTSTMAVDSVFGNYAPQKWYKVIMSYNKDDKSINVYVNGKHEISTKLHQQTMGSRQHIKFCIGEANTSYLYNYQWTFNGIIDQVRVYNRVLSEKEINKLYVLKY